MARVQRRRAQSTGGDQVLFDLLPAPAYIFDDRTLQFLAVNTAALERYGYTRGEFLKLNLLDIRPAEDRKAVRESVATDAKLRRYRAVLRHMTSENDVFYVEGDMARLFNAFEQLDSRSTRRHEGSGLGLHLTHKLAELLGAQVLVESTYGSGSTFTLVLPSR
jgi:PAS domain S-box-containing protein